MPTYTCELCKFSTKLKGNYTEHLNTKKHKKLLEKLSSTKEKEEPPIIKYNLKFTCEHCDQTFSSKAILKRHIKQYCKVFKHVSQNAILLKRIENLEKKQEDEKKELYKKINKLIEKVGSLQNK